MVGAEELESSTHRVRAGCVAANTSLPHGADAANRTRVSSVPGTRSATELRRLEALIGFEPMTCSFGRSRAGPLRYRAKCRYQVSGARCQKKGFPALLTPDTRHLTPRTWGDWRESNPLTPDPQSGPAPFGFSHRGAATENRTPVCWLRVSGSATELSQHGGATGIRTRTSPLKRRVCRQEHLGPAIWLLGRESNPHFAVNSRAFYR